MKAIDGYKTYIVAFGVVVVGALETYGVIDQQTAQMAWFVLTGAGLAAARSAWSKK